MRWKASAVENIENLDLFRERRGARERVAFQSQACVISQVTCSGRGRVPAAVETWLDSAAIGEDTHSAPESRAPKGWTSGFDTFGMGRC